MTNYESSQNPIKNAHESMAYQIPEKIKQVHIKLIEAGYQAYLVGGCVRDLLLDREPKDWDITTNAKPEEIEALYEKSFYENKFGTVSVLTGAENKALQAVEITPYRTESKYSDKRHPDEVQFTDKLEDDLARRDFTINSMAFNPVSGDIIDPFDGQKSLKNKEIKAVGDAGERFEEDALRIMRAVRLATELDFDIEKNTEKAVREKSGLLDIISRERIRDELVKIIMSENPTSGLEKMRDLGILKHIMPELEEGYGIGQNKHHVYTVWEHNLRALAHAVEKKQDLDVRMASLLHDVGKPRSKRGEGPDSTFYGHEVIGAKMTFHILSRLKFPKKFIDKVVKLVRYHLFFSDTDVLTLSAVRRIVKNVGPENIWDLMNVRYADRIGMGRPKEQPFRLRKYQAMIEQAMRDPISVSMLKIDGSRIMSLIKEKPGPKIGYILNILLEDVLENPELNTEEYLENKTLELKQMSEGRLMKLGIEAKNKSSMVEKEEIQAIEKKHGVA